MRAVSILALGAALVASSAQAQVIQRSVSEEPVETTVTATPDGTVVTRRPVGAEAPASIDSITTREVVQRVERPRVIERAAPRVSTRVIRERRDGRVVRDKVVRENVVRPAREREFVTRDVRLSSPTSRVIALSPAERHIVYQTIVERSVVPGPRIPPTYVEPGYRYGEPLAVTPPVVAADDDDIEMTTPTYAVGATLPRGVPLFAVPQDVGYRVPAASPYSYAYVGGRAYLVDPGSSVIVADVTE